MKNLKYLLFIVIVSLLAILPFEVKADTPDQVTITSDGLADSELICGYLLDQIDTNAGRAYCVQGYRNPPANGCVYIKSAEYTEDPGMIKLLQKPNSTKKEYNCAQGAIYGYIKEKGSANIFPGWYGASGDRPPGTAGPSDGGYSHYGNPYYNDYINEARNATGNATASEGEATLAFTGTDGSEACDGDYIKTKIIKVHGENIDWSTFKVGIDGMNAEVVENTCVAGAGTDCSLRLKIHMDEAQGHQSLNIWANALSNSYSGRYYVYTARDPQCQSYQDILFTGPGRSSIPASTTISFNPDACTDYSLDVSCGNCDTTGDKPSFIIQDTTNWSGIVNSSLSSNSNINGYFDQASGGSTGSGGGKCHVYCREEYRVYFPNEDDEVNVGAGRHFTFNLEGDIVIGTVPNYKEVKVDKIKECQATEEYEVTDPETGVTRTEQKSSPSCMSQYDASQSKPKAGETGDVTIQYTETYQDSVYNANNPIKLKQNDSRQEIPEETVSGASATYEVINWYELPDNTYRYIDMQTGESSFKMPSGDLTNHYRDLGSSNLPLSYENYGINVGGENVGAYVGFAFALPGSSNMSEAFLDNNDYFKTSSTSNDNMYTKYVNNGCSDKGDTKLREELMGSTCAEMYGYGTSGFCECAKSKQSNKAGNCIANINSGLDSNYYQCEVLVCPEGEFTCSNGECSKNKLCPGTPTGGGDDPDGGDPGDGTGGYCEDCKGGICCPGLNMVCPDENGECPVPAGGEIIYRTIDLDNPFPGQADGRRDTGWNWCSYNVETNKISCNGMGNGNPMVHRNIINNRGYSSEKIYQSTPMYEFDLTPDNIKSIRKYNRSNNHKYSDWTLKCNGDGADKICYSTFLRNNDFAKIKSSSTCADKSRLGTCDDNGKER